MRKKTQEQALNDVIAPKNPKRPIMIASAFALAASLLAMPFMSKPADATLADGGFCIQASGFEGVDSKVVGPSTCLSVADDGGATPSVPEDAALDPVVLACETEIHANTTSAVFRWDSVAGVDEYLVELVGVNGEVTTESVSTPEFRTEGGDKSENLSSVVERRSLTVSYELGGKRSPKSDSSVFEVYDHMNFRPFRSAQCA